MSDKPIFEVPVSIDREGSLDAFLAKLAQARQALSDVPLAWGGTAAPKDPTPSGLNVSGGGSGGLGGRGSVSGTGTSSGKAVTNFEQAAKASRDPHLTGQSSFVERFRKSSFESEKSWKSITRELEKSLKSLSGLSRISFSTGNMFSSLGLLGAGGAAAGAVAGAVVGAADNLAGQNLINRQLALKPGEETAFTTNYAKVGGSTATLQAANEAKLNPVEGQKLMALGIGPQEVQNLSTTDLAALMLERGGQTWNKYGNQSGLYWQKFGLGQFVDPGSAQAAGSYLKQDPDAFTRFHQSEQADIPKFAQQQKDLDKATDAKKQFDSAWAEDVAAFDRAFVKLTPEFTAMATGAAKWVDAFSKSGELDTDMKALEGGFHDLVGVMKELHLINNKTKGTDQGLNGPINAVDKNGWQFGNWLEKEFPGYAKWRKDQSDWLGPDSDRGVGTGTLDDNATPNTRSPWNGGNALKPVPDDGSPYSKLLDAIAMNESSGNPDALNRKTGAAGLYGLMPANYQAAHVDPYDPASSRALASEIFSGFYAKFHDFAKAAAAYDGDTHISEDEKKYNGDWLKGAKQETIDYLKKLELQGQGLDLTPSQQAYIDKATTVKRQIDYPDTVHGGGGYNFSMPKPAMNSQQTPIAVKVDVSVPAGASANVSIGGISH